MELAGSLLVEGENEICCLSRTMASFNPIFYVRQNLWRGWLDFMQQYFRLFVSRTKSSFAVKMQRRVECSMKMFSFELDFFRVNLVFCVIVQKNRSTALH